MNRQYGNMPRLWISVSGKPSKGKREKNNNLFFFCWPKTAWFPTYLPLSFFSQKKKKSLLHQGHFFSSPLRPRKPDSDSTLRHDFSPISRGSPLTHSQPGAITFRKTLPSLSLPPHPIPKSPHHAPPPPPPFQPHRPPPNPPPPLPPPMQLDRL